MRNNTALAVGKGVQFSGADQVLKAYTSRDLAAFALWCGKQFLFTYEGDSIDEGEELLKTWLDNLKDSAATYTLTTYKSWEGEDITAQTPFHGSFNFKLLDRPLNYLGEAYGAAGGNWKHLADELQAYKAENADLRAQVAELEAELQELEKEKESGLGGMLGGMATGLLQNPAITNTIAEGIAGWIGKLLTPAQTGSPRALAGNEAVQWQGRVNEVQAAEVNNSLNMLFAVPGIDVPQLLVMLADLAVQDPGKFLQYVEMFRTMSK